MAKFKTIVKRSEWLRGTGAGVLRNAEGMKCCLGFRCEQAGLVPEGLQSVEMPSEARGRSVLPAWLLNREAKSTVDNAAAINDERKKSEEEREAELKEIFAAQGEEIEFVD